MNILCILYLLLSINTYFYKHLLSFMIAPEASSRDLSLPAPNKINKISFWFVIISSYDFFFWL